MRILYGHCLSDTQHPAARMVHSIARELQALGVTVHVHEPEVATSRSASVEGSVKRAQAKRMQGVRDMLWFAGAIAHDRKAVAADVAAIRAFGPDVVLARHDAYRGSLIRAARAEGVPVVVYADAPVAHEIRHWSDPASRRFHPPGLVETYERRHLARAQAIVAVSEPGRQCLDAYGTGIPVTVIRNGVGPEFLGPLPAHAEKMRARLELGIDAPFVIGFVGTFKPFHGIDLLEDLVRVTADWDDTAWLFVGDGPRKHALINRLNEVRARVTDLGPQPHHRLPGLYALMNVAVAPYPPSRYPFHFCPLKILEAQASGAVVVASDRGDIPILLQHGQTGIAMADDAPAAWADALRDLIDNPTRRDAIACRARENVAEHHTWRNTALDLLVFLQDLSAKMIRGSATGSSEN